MAHIVPSPNVESPPASLLLNIFPRHYVFHVLRMVYHGTNVSYCLCSSHRERSYDDSAGACKTGSGFHKPLALDYKHLYFICICICIHTHLYGWLSKLWSLFDPCFNTAPKI